MVLDPSPPPLPPVLLGKGYSMKIERKKGLRGMDKR